MPRSALLASAAAVMLTVAAAEAGAAIRVPVTPRIAGLRTDPAFKPAIVMFELAIIRMRMLNTLTELIRRGDRVLALRRW